MKIQDFLFEALDRFLTKNPIFFRYIQIVAAVLFLISYVIDKLQQAHIAIPAWVIIVGSSSVKISAMVAAFIAQFPNPNPSTIKSIPDEKAIPENH